MSKAEQSKELSKQWEEWRQAFPATASDESKLRYLLRYAVLAPSIRNTQPWLWKIGGNEAHLYADPTRQVPGFDPDGRELINSCGASLEYLCRAIRNFGFSYVLDETPDPDSAHLLARIRLSRRRKVTVDDELLFRAMPYRRTNRHEFDASTLSPDLHSALQAEAGQRNCWLHFIEDQQPIQQVLDIIAQGDLIQSQDQKVRNDIANWTTSGNPNRSDGIPGEALNLSPLFSAVAPVAMRVLDRGDKRAARDRGDKRAARDRGDKQAARDRRLVSSASLLVVLGTQNDTHRDWLTTGRALTRVLLRASAAGVSASFFNQPIEIAELWARLRHIIGRHDFPQVMFRLGYPTAESIPTPRRHVSEIIASD